MEPIEVAPGEYHLSSRDPKTGRILKSEDHDTFYNSVIEDDKLGYVTYKSKDGNIYSKKQYEIDIAGDAQEIFRVDDTGAVVKESVVGEKEPVSKVEREASKRKLDFEVTRDQLLSVDVKDKLFDKDYTDGLLDVYAPKDVKVREAQGDPRSIRFVDVMKRDQEKEYRYNLALNEAKKSVLQDKLYGLAESGETYIDIAEADLDKNMNSLLESLKYADGPGREYRSTIDKLTTPKLVKKKADNIYEMLLPDHVSGAEYALNEYVRDWVNSKAEEIELSDEAKVMMKYQVINEYKNRKLLDAASSEVSKETGYNLDNVKGDFKKVTEEIDGFDKELKALYIPYEEKARRANERMTLEFEQIQDKAINRVSNSQEYKDLLSEYQAKVNSGEITVEEANSAVSQKINIMLSQSPEAVEIQRKYQGVLSSYESELRKKTESIYIELQSSLDQLKGLSVKNEEYKIKIQDKIKEMYKAEQSEIESDYRKLPITDIRERETRLSRALYGGTGDIVSGIVGGIEMKFGESEFTRKLIGIGKQLKADNPLIDMGEFGFDEFMKDPLNEDFWLTRVAPSAPMTFSLMIPGIGLGTGTAALATRVGLAGLSRALITGGVTGLGMRSAESFTEAGLHYYDLIERGESVEYASKDAAKVYSKNMDLAGLDILEYTTFFLPAASRLATFAKVAVQVPLNSFEELIQEGLPAEELAYNRYLKGELTQKEIADGVSQYEKVFSGGTLSDVYNFLQTKQGQEVAIIGGIYGGAFGGASLPGDMRRTNSLRKLNNFLNEEIVRYSSTDVVRNAEGKPLEFGMGGVVAGPAETRQEAKNRRIWQLKSTLDEMQMKGVITEDDAKLGKKQVDFAFGVADQMPVNLPLVTRGQLLQKLTEIRDLEEGLDGMTNETLIDAQKKKIAKLKKESEEIIGGTAQGYFINNVSLTKEQFIAVAANPKFADRVISGEIDFTILNDNKTQDFFKGVIEGYKTDKESYESAMESLGVTKAVRDQVSGYNESVTKEGGIGAKIAPIMTRVENSERINEKEIDAAIDDIFAEIEAVQNSDLNEKTKEIITNTLYDTATQLDNYEFTTETRTKTVTQSRTAKNLGAFAEKVSVENFFANAAGTIDGEENVRFTTDKGVVKATREDGTEFILDTPSMRIDDGDIVFDENGVLESVTVTDRSGTRVTFTGETAMDLAIRDGQNKVGSVPEAALQQIITEEVQVEEEVLKKQPKTKKDAIQEQAAGEVPIQPEAKAGEKVEEGEPKAEPEVTTQKGKEKEVAPATQGIVSKLLEKVSNSNDDAVTKKRKRAALRAVANILNFKSNILPDTKVKVHETDESYRSATGVDGPGVYDATNDTIHINLAHEEAGDETVYHEMIHPIIYSAVKNETEARILTQRMVEGIVRSSGGNKAIVDKLKGWLEQYEASERPEETIAEVAGFLASEFKNLTLSAKNIIKDYLNKMARKFGGKDLFRAVSKDADVVKVLNRLSEAMRAGEAITAEDLRAGEFEIKMGVERDVEQGTLVEGAEGTIPEGIDDSKGSPIDLKLRMPKALLDRGGINIQDIKRGSINDLSGANAFVFAADQATYGLVESPSGVEYRFFGGYLFPYGNNFAWAFTGEEGANKVVNKVNESDGIGLVMSQAPDGIKGSLAFWEYMYAEIENAISKGVSEEKILKYVNSKLQLAGIPDALKEKGIKTQIDRLDELKTLMPIEGKNKISYEVRGSFTKSFFSATSFDDFGIPPLNKTAKVDLGVLDYVNDPSLKNVEYGDIISAIQFDKNAKPIRLSKDDPNYHPSYPVVLPGKPIMVFNNAVDVRDVYPNAVPKSKEASQVPLGQRKKPAAARSAMGGQYIAEVPSGISEGQPIIKQRKASPEKFVSELEKTKDSDPTQYWSVNYVSLSAAKKGKVISVDGGYGFVSNDGDIKGVFKLPTSKVKGVADNILQEAVNQGGTKLDNFDGYLTKIYERNGFRIAARIPFNEEIAPDGWNKAKHGTPDVVAMVYDPNNELGIKEKKFDDYDAGIEYRDSFLEDKAPAPKKTGVKERKAISAHEETGFISTDFWVDNLRGKTKYLDDVVENILESREELKKGSVPIDKVTRAYLVTIGSVGSRGSYYENWSKKTGSTVDDIFLEKEKGREWIRPEGATAAYLVTDEGKKLVKDIQSGKATYDQVKKLFDFADFGRSNQKTEYVMNAISKGGIQSFNKSLNKNKGKDFNEIYSLAIKNLPGIAEGKTGFINQFFGVSTRGVIDARQLNAWVGGSMKLTDSQKQLRKKVESSDALKAELLNRIEKVGLELGYSEDIAAYIAHHAIWDKVANTITSHKGEYKVVSGKQRKAAPDQKVRASIDFKNRYGKYFTISKEFNNQKHLDNYISFMERKGNKEVGTETFPIGLKERKSKPTGKIDWTRSPEGKGDPAITQRNEAVQEAAKQLKQGEITNEQYRQTVLDNSPISPITTFFEPATDSEMSNALSSDKVEKLNSPIKENQVVGLRLDIPAYLNKNTWVVSVHDGPNISGKAISYRNVGRITDVNFSVTPVGAINIAEGKSKQTIARMYGKWKNFEGATTEEQGENAKKIVDDIWKSDEWVQVGMNPFRHSYFYDRSKNIGMPVVSADEVIQIGGLVYAKDVKYASPDADIFIVKSLTDKEGKPLKFRKPRIKDGLEDSIDDQKKAGIIKRLIDSPGKIIRGTNKQLFDFRGELKDYMRNQEELEYAYYRTINALGSGGVAKLAFDKAYEKIYDGLGPTKRDDLDKIIIARRIISINQSRAFNNLDKIEGLFNSPPKFFTKKGGEYLASFEQTMIDLIDTVSNSPLLKDMIIEEAETLMSMMPVMNSIASNQNLTQKEILSEQNKVINELKNALDKVLKAENVTFTNNRGVKNGLNEAYELLDSKRNEIGDKVFDELNDRADKYFAKFQEMLDQDLADGIISQEQYDAMTGIEYSPRVFMQTVLDINDDIINSREGSEYVDRMLASNFGMNKDAIKTLRDGIDAKSKPDATDKAFFEMVTNSEVILGNYINSRERLRKMNDLNLYMANEITALETKLNTLSNKASLTNEEQMELETIKETLDAFSTKKSNGYLPVRYYENGVKKQFYIRGDLYNQWYNIRPGSLIGDSAVGKVVDKILSSPVAVLKTFATGALSPLFGITASAIDLQQLMIFSDAKGFSEIMPLKAAQIAKDLVGVPFYQRGVIRSIISEDELFTEAVNEGIMMDFLYTQGGMADAAKLIRTGLESVIEKSDLGYAGYVRTRKALLKIAEATLILNKAAEIAPRLTAYQRTRDFEYAKIDKMVQQQGLSNEEEEKMRKNARIKAAAIARDLMNFSEGGESTKQLDKYSTYLNAAMQGTVTAAREYKKNPIRTTSRMAQSAAMFFGTVIGMASFLVWSLKDDDDDKWDMLH
jgi:hypothetical protein